MGAAIPVIMGINIGIPITKTIMALMPAGDQSEFRWAFAGTTIHDFFNWLSILVLLFLEPATYYLKILANLVVNTFHFRNEEDAPALLKVFTDPYMKLNYSAGPNLFHQIAMNDGLAKNKSLNKIWCKTSTNRTQMNASVP